MKPDEEIRATPNLQSIGNPFGIGECGYFWKLGKRVASVIWTRKDGHVSVSPMVKHVWMKDEIEKIKSIFFNENEFDSIDILRNEQGTGTVHLYQNGENKE